MTANKLAQNPDYRRNISFEIDVEAEIRKLCRERQKTSGQYIVDIVSQLIGLGAEAIDIERRSGKLEILCTPGRKKLATQLFPALLIIFNPTIDHTRRHQALLILESLAGLGLLAPFAQKNYHTTIEWTENGKNRRYVFRPGRAPRARPPTGYPGIAVRLRSSKKNLRGELAYARKHCRFATHPIRIDRKKINRALALENCIAETPFKEIDCSGALGIPREGELITLTELRDGIVMRETVHPPLRGLVFNAIIETGSQHKKNLLTTLLPRVEGVCRGAATQFDRFREEDQRRILWLLLKRSLAAGDHELLNNVRGFATVAGPKVTLSEIMRLAKKEPIFVLDRESDGADYQTNNAAVLKLDKKDRELLEQLSGLQFSPPPRKSAVHTIGRKPLYLAKSLLKKISHRFSCAQGPEVDDEELTPREHQFLRAVRLELASGSFDLLTLPKETRVCMTDHQKRPAVITSTDKGSTFVMTICRSDHTVRKMISLFAIDPSVIHPALTHLTEHTYCPGRYF